MLDQQRYFCGFLSRIDIAVRNRCIEICFWPTLFDDLT